MGDVVLRDYQEASVAGLRAGIVYKKRKQVLVAPTGSGKTEIACHMLQEASRKMSRALFIVDRVVLVDQTSQRLDRYAIPHGVLQYGHWRTRPYERIQVCSAQTLERRGIPEDVQVVFVDEAHCMRKKVTEYLETTNAVVVGLTATPFTRGMGQVYDGLINSTTTNELIARGLLVPLKAYAAKAVDIEGMKVVAGEWSEKEIEERGMAIIGDVVSEWQDKTNLHFGGPVKTLVFSATVAHGEELCRQFQAAGFNFQQISYKDGDDDERKRRIEEFRRPDSEIQGLISCEVLTKGFDVADAQCGISARPYRKSLSSHVQQLGRIMRPSPGKEFGLWLDHSGNYLRFYCDVEHLFENGVDSLDECNLEEKARKEPTAKEREDFRCSGCGFILPPRATVCPACGKERRRPSDVETLPGTMIEVGGKKLKPEWQERRLFLSGLRYEALHKGYMPGWVSHKYRDKYGEWPNDLRVADAPPVEPSDEQRRWLKSRAIRYAKRRAARA